MNTAAMHPISLARLLIPYAVLALSGCDCRSERETWPEEVLAEPGVFTGEPPLTDAEDLTPAQRAQVAELIALVKHYYPVWDPERESLGDYYDGWEQTPEIQRYKARIDEREANDHAWRACLREIQDALRSKFFVQGGTPPKFYIPSFQVVISTRYRGGHVTMVFRISMLAPWFDYYQSLTDATRDKQARSLAPTRDTREVAAQVRGIIVKHFPEYQEMPPEMSMVRLPDIELGLVTEGDESLGHALFEDDRAWW